ncbi:MAG: hypothetical protein PVF40_00640 [Ectothiorhodospiraceae bacterium]
METDDDSGKDDESGAAGLLYQLNRARELRRVQVDSEGLDPAVARLRRWQSERLERTHADLLADRRSRSAMEFFLDELYGPYDFSQRDQDIERIYPIMIRVLPAAAVHTLTRALELNSLSHELDQRLLEVLENELGVRDEITEETYAEAYRRCANPEERARQIDLIDSLGRDLTAIVGRRRTGWLLRVARRPARAAGFGELQSFLERGYDAFRRMPHPQEFLDKVVERERRIMENLFDAAEDPFDLPA